MLTPDEVNGYAGLMAAPWDELNERILRDMVRRIVKAGKITSTAEWQSFRAQALGASRAYLLRQMQAIVQELGPQEAAVFAQAINRHTPRTCWMQPRQADLWLLWARVRKRSSCWKAATGAP